MAFSMKDNPKIGQEIVQAAIEQIPFFQAA
jgi:hypothetical protein